MASRVEGFDEKILLCAKEEFLEKGYADALETVKQDIGCQILHGHRHKNAAYNYQYEDIKSSASQDSSIETSSGVPVLETGIFFSHDSISPFCSMYA